MSPTKSLPTKIDELFHPINDDVTWLHTIWELYLQLYCATDQNYDVMNSSAPQFFAILKNVLFEELILIVGRLTDPPRTFGKDNASIERLIELIEGENFPALASSLRKRLDKFRDEHTAFRIWRNRRVDHSDMKTVMKGVSDPMPGIPRNQAQAAVDELAAMMSEILEKRQGQAADPWKNTTHIWVQARASRKPLGVLSS